MHIGAIERIIDATEEETTVVEMGVGTERTVAGVLILVPFPDQDQAPGQARAPLGLDPAREQIQGLDLVLVLGPLDHAPRHPEIRKEDDVIMKIKCKISSHSSR
jgi:hypothetical protein